MAVTRDPDLRLALATMIGTWRVVFRYTAARPIGGDPVTSSMLARGGSRQAAIRVARGAVAVRSGVASSHLRVIECEAVDVEARLFDARDARPR